MKHRHVIGIAVILTFVVFSAFTFQNSLTPYVNFAQAQSIAGTVQVRGILATEQIMTAEGGRLLQFVLRDETGIEALVAYRGSKPDGLEDAASIVAIGKYRDGLFMAEKLLVKCPSKYQSTQGSVKR